MLRVPHLLAQHHYLQRSDHPARVRPERPHVVGAHAQRRRFVRAGLPREEGILKRKCSLLFALCSWLLLATPAQAAVTDYIGRTVIEVHLESGAAELRDPRLLEIVDTRAGQPLAMAEVRATRAHL